MNLATERATVTGHADPEAMLAAIAAAGYAARPVDGADDPGRGLEAADAERRRETARLRRDLIVAALLTLPVFVLEMGSHLLPGMAVWVEATLGTRNSWLLQFVLTTAVLAGPGRRFYQAGLPALARLAPDMNSLVAVGTLAAGLFRGGHLCPGGCLRARSTSITRRQR